MNKATAIHGQLTSRLSTWAAARTPKLTVLFEGQPATPPSGTYLREYMRLGTPRAAGCGNEAKNYVDGFYQVDVVADPTGWGFVNGIGDEIATLFNRSKKLTATGVELTIKSAIPSGIIKNEGDAKIFLPVTINFYVYADV